MLFRSGERRYIPTNRTYTNKEGKVVKNTTKSTKMFEAKDARELSSGTLMEDIYADHANKLKSLANQARKEAMSTQSVPYSASARKAYAKEVSSLDAKYKLSLRNKPLERQAQLITDTVVRAKIRANPELKDDKDHLKKVKQQALREARDRTGASRSNVVISDKEWEAIQAGAIHKTRLEAILTASDADRVRELAMPKTTRVTSPAVISRAKSMRASGATQAEIADALGLSTTTINTILRD